MRSCRVLHRPLFILLAIWNTTPLWASTVVRGNISSTTQTFDFTVGPAQFIGSSNQTMNALIGASEEKANNTFALALHSPGVFGVTQFVPLAVTKVTLNDTKNQNNPLTGKQIKYASILNQDFYVSVINQTKSQSERFTTVYKPTLADTSKPTQTTLSVLQSAVPKDAHGANAGHIVALATASTDDASLGLVAFAAVTQNGSDFGIGNSGITAIKYAYPKNNAASPTATQEFRNLNTGKAGNSALALNASSRALNVGSGTPTIETSPDPVIDMHWDSTLKRLYLVVRITSASGASNGIRALVIGRLQDGKLTLEKCIPDAAVLSSANNIICARNGGSASLYKVRTMHTSTRLSYLIVNGGTQAAGHGGIAEVANQIYAIPLVRFPTQKTDVQKEQQGLPADVTKDPVTNFDANDQHLTFRSFTHIATTSSQLCTTSDRAAVVGGGPLPLNTSSPARTITDLFVSGDAVYACVPYAYENGGQEPGIFKSQAIFDHVGRIAAWTPWQRVGGSDDYSYTAHLAARTGGFWMLTGKSSTTINTVKYTQWGACAKDGLLGGTTSDSSVGLINVLSTALPCKNGGIQGFMQYNEYESGIDGVTVLLATGTDSVIFVKTGDNSQATNTIKPFTGNFASGAVYSTDGSFPAGGGRIFGTSGGVLSQLGPITSCAIFSSGDGLTKRSWIAVGGYYGMAILSDANGNGFTPTNLPTGFTFKKVGPFNQIRKIVGDGQYLYVLTARGFERVIIDPATFKSGTLRYTNLASDESLLLGNHGCFYDVLIGDKLALLATNRGIWRTANGSTIKSGTPQWTSVSLNESLGPVYSLSSASSSNTSTTGLAQGAQVYALSAYQGFDDARIYRLYVNEGTTLSNTSVQNIGDEYIKDKPTYFASFGQLRSFYAFDGSVQLVCRPVNTTRAMGLFALPPFMEVAQRGFPTINSAQLEIDSLQTSIIDKPLRLSVSGAWVISGEFGLRVNE